MSAETKARTGQSAKYTAKASGSLVPEQKSKVHISVHSSSLYFDGNIKSLRRQLRAWIIRMLMQDEVEANRGGLQITEAAVRESKRRESKA